MNNEYLFIMYIYACLDILFVAAKMFVSLIFETFFDLTLGDSRDVRDDLLLSPREDGPKDNPGEFLGAFFKYFYEDSCCMHDYCFFL